MWRETSLHLRYPFFRLSANNRHGRRIPPLQLPGRASRWLLITRSMASVPILKELIYKFSSCGVFYVKEATHE